MKNFVSIYIYLIIYVRLLLIPGCNQGTDHPSEAGEIIKLSGDGSWGYAGHFAYIEGDDIHIVTLRVEWAKPLAGNEISMSEGIYYTRYNVIEGAFFHSDGSHSFGINDTPVYETKYFHEIWHWSRDGNEQQRALWSDILSDEGRLTTVVIPGLLDRSERKFDVLWLEGRMEGCRDYETKVMSFKKH